MKTRKQEKPVFSVIDTPTHFETPYFQIKYNAKKKWVEGKWKDYANDDEYRLLLRKELEILEKTNSRSLLIDARDYKGASDEILNWIENVWSKLAYKSGLINFAIVVKPEIYKTARINKSFNVYFYKLINGKIFNDIESAYKWLEKHKNAKGKINKNK